MSYCHHWASVVCRPSSVVRPLTFHILINSSDWANLNQTLVEWSLDGPLPKLCPVIPTSNQDGRQAQKSYPLKPLNQIKPNLAGWVPFKIVSDSPALHSRWPLLLKIEISSNGKNCSILSQNVPKFELYKHNNELFNIYYWNFELLPILTDYAN